EMHGRAADRLAGIVRAELQRVGAVDDALVAPVELGLMRLVGSKILERPPIGAGIERDDREAVFGELAGEGAGAGTGSDDDNIDPLVGACGRIGPKPPTRKTWGARPSTAGGTACGSADTGILSPGFGLAAGRRLDRLPRVAAIGGESDIAARARRTAKAD